MGDFVTYSDAGIELRGIVERPDQPNGAGVLVVHEAPGLGDNARRRTRMLAELGYVALAADLYGGGRVYSGDAAVEKMDALRSDPAAFRARVRAGYNMLAAMDGVDPLRVAAVGYCFGGMAVLELARSGAPAAAVVSFHGLLTTGLPAQPAEVSARVLACTGALDPLVPLEDVTAFQEEMTHARADWQLIVYGDCYHSFTNPNVQGMGDPRMKYSATADRQSWAAALLFLEEVLGTPSSG